MLAAVLWYGLMLAAAVQLFFLIAFFLRIFSLSSGGDSYAHRALVPKYTTERVSVLICAKNESANLATNLEKVLGQDFVLESGEKAFEVIVVNDESADNTAAVLDGLSLTHPHLRIVDIPAGTERSLPGKKFALSRALAAASHDLIVCIDADCEPGSEVWLHFMAAPFSKGREIVAGYGGYRRLPGMLNRFIRYETLHTFLQYYSFAKAGLPYMAVGRNLAATKQAFLKAQAHPTWKLLPSGDDDLLVQLCGTKENVAVVSHPASFTWSDAKRTLDEYFRQKQRHVSTGKYYRPVIKCLLAGYALSIALWWPLLLAYLCTGVPSRMILLVLPLAPISFLVTILQQGAMHMKERTTTLGWFGFYLCWVLYNTVLAPYILWKNRHRWK